MPAFGFRPRHKAILPESAEWIEARIRQQLRRNNPSDLKLRKEHEALVLRFPSHISRIWTPQVRIRLAPLDRSTAFHTIIGPSYRIWRFFRGALIAFGITGIAGLFIAFLNWGNGGGTWGLYVLLIGLAGGLFLYFLSEEAKRRTRDEVDLLKAFIEGALDQPIFRAHRPSRAMDVARPATQGGS
ncbi:MAG: hypothetical protein KIT10_02840 [Flavobacteriales bacterium]|nr:hypothetical protein [Flavobacteriales bacterium]